MVPIQCRETAIHFLLIQHRAGHWGFPKGHPDAGETALATACREFEEETGITHYQPITTLTWQECYQAQRKGEPVDKQVTYFLAIVAQEQVTIQVQEIQAYRWATFAEALDCLTYPTSRDLLRQVQHYLTSQDSPVGDPGRSLS